MKLSTVLLGFLYINFNEKQLENNRFCSNQLNEARSPTGCFTAFHLSQLQLKQIETARNDSFEIARSCGVFIVGQIQAVVNDRRR